MYQHIVHALDVQVLPRSGDPASLRLQLKGALPHAPPPEEQVVQDIAIFHITVARLLAPALHAVPIHAAIGNNGAGQVRPQGEPYPGRLPAIMPLYSAERTNVGRCRM